MNKSIIKDKEFMMEAIEEAKRSLKEGGLPIGSVLVKNGEIISRGHNKLIQNNSVILHGEMDAIENAGRLNGEDYRQTTLYTTLSPCPMCSGAIILYHIKRVVVGENSTLMGAENLLKENGIELKCLNMKEPRELLNQYIKDNPEDWRGELEKVGSTTSLK
ncbi:MAG: nucleoside deaminase [Methanobrevibacter sp.]|jgi:cytosine deaminase|nr:nucleoside deaminase [Methanobrevibacter sp.]